MVEVKWGCPWAAPFCDWIDRKKEMEPMRLIVKKELSADQRAVAIYGGFNLRIFVQGKYVEIGRGSFSALRSLHFFSSIDFAQERICSIGQFVEVANAKIMLGGEHPRSDYGYTTFSGLYDILALAEKKIQDILPYSKGPIIIGNSVVVSEGAILLSGVTIENDVLIAAGSLLPKGHYRSGVWAGCPPRLLKENCKIEPFWQRRTIDIARKLTIVRNNDINSNIKYDDCLFLEFEGELKSGRLSRINFLGIERGGLRVNCEQLPFDLKRYFFQVAEKSPLEINLEMDQLILKELFS